MSACLSGETDSLKTATIASPSTSRPGASNRHRRNSSKLHTVWFSNAAPPKAATNAGNSARYTEDSGYSHRSTGSAINADTNVAITFG